ncbi:DUF362 domain-containing protein [Candidatus Latescibacterota bacterium]
MIKIKQLFKRDSIENPSGELSLRLRDSVFIRRIRPDARIAITAGSRGINGIDALIRAVADVLKDAGAKPFVVPAMGSHGGATPDGQREMLESFGITEDAVGVPIMSSMETEITGITSAGENVYMDKNAFDADGIVVMNRIKLHTAYRGKVESGLCKMVSVGLGKRDGAESIHRQGLGDVIVESFRVSRDTGKLLFGIGILENAFDETCEFRIAGPDEFETVDSELLEKCTQIMPRIPFDEFDILIVDEIGKNLSGTGMDTNVIGFWRRIGGERKPDYKTLIVRDLTEESHGNALGVGFADLVTRRLFNKIDFSATYTNGITTGNWSTVRLPITLETDSLCVTTALNKHTEGTARIVRIKNTLELEELYISEPLLEEAEHRENLEITGEPEEMKFDSDGNLI